VNNPRTALQIFAISLFFSAAVYAGKSDKKPVRPCHVEIALGHHLTLRLPLDETSVRRLYLTIREKWIREFSRDLFTQALTPLSVGDLSQVRDHAVALKEVRKTGDRLRSAYRVLTVNHRVPEGLKGFVRELGTLNDILSLQMQEDPAMGEVEAGDEVDVEKLAGLAYLLLVQLHDARLVETLPIPAMADETSIAKFIKQSFKDSLALLVHPDGRRRRQIRAKDFHDVRKHLKDIRAILNLFRPYIEAEFAGAYQSVYHDLHLITKGMGKTNDAIERERHRAKRVKDPNFYKQYRLDLPHELFSQIITFLNRFDFPKEKK